MAVALCCGKLGARDQNYPSPVQFQTIDNISINSALIGQVCLSQGEDVKQADVLAHLGISS
jgi:hypothetical protein